MSVRYEWDLEIFEEGVDPESGRDFEDVLEHIFVDTYREGWEKLVAFNANPSRVTGQQARIVLVRDRGDERAWAEVLAGVFMSDFINADGVTVAKIPQRYRDEVSSV